MLYTRLVSDNKDILHNFFNLKNYQLCKQTGFLTAVVPQSDFSSPSMDFWQSCYKHRITFGFRSLNERIRAVFFDMDSTVIQEESVDELGKLVGKADEIVELTQNAMSGLLPYREVYHRRLKLLREVSMEQLASLHSRLSYHVGIRETLRKLKKNKINFFLISSGFCKIVEQVSEELGFDACQGNKIKFVDGFLTADDKNDIIDSDGKRAWVEARCRELGVGRCAVAVVGDGANDAAMMQGAGTAVGFDPHRVLLEHVTAVNFSGDHSFLVPLLTSE